MTSIIPDSHRDLLDRPVFAAFTTLLPDGQPHSSVVWIDYDGEYVLVNTARGRRKDRNVAANHKVSVLSYDPDNPYRYLEVRGIVEEITEDGALDHIHKLSLKYTGRRYYGDFAPAERQSQETRVIYKIRATKVVAH